MPANTPHPEYERFSPLWETAYDVTDGEYVIKAKGPRYLPMLAGMDNLDYADYLVNAEFFGGTARTIQGFLGAAFRVNPTVEVLPSMKSWEENITLSGLSLDALLKKDVEDKFKTGRYGFRIDYSEEQRRPYLAYYTAPHVVNWDEEIIDGHKILTMVVLCEEEILPGKDRFERERKDVYHVLELVNGECQASKIRQVGNTATWIEEMLPPPTRFGVPLDFIPFVFDGVSDTTPSCEKPPLLDMIFINLSHYRLTADYFDALRFVSKPQPWIGGMSKQDEELRIGSRSAWFLPPPGATANYLEYTGAGIGAIRQALIDREAIMARLGASVLEEPKAGVESAETARINQSSKTSLLSSITGTTGQAATQALRMMGWWAGLTEDLQDPRIQVVMNQDFIEARMTPQDLLALVQSWQARGISRNTLTYNVRRGGLLPDDITEKEEMELIDSEAPLPTSEPEDLDTPREGASEEPAEEEAA